jgi:hypothetical protein
MLRQDTTMLRQRAALPPLLKWLGTFRAINSITTSSRLSDEGRLDLWSRVAGVPLETAVDNRTRRAAGVFSTCLDDLRREAVFGLRDCLEGRRDELLINANVRLWNGLAAGS